MPKVPKVPGGPRARGGHEFLLVAALALSSGWAEAATEVSFDVKQRAEALAKITVTCDACAWEIAGREAVVLSITLDGRYIQHVPVVRSGRAEYHVLIGRVEPGRHHLRVEADPALTPTELREGRAVVDGIVIDQTSATARDYTALSLAPILHARPDTVGRFTDVPVFMWYEIEPTTRGTRYRYSVIFTNEDGGTPADRLMATWGRTTDIEYVYSVEVDRNGTILADDIQGPDHKILPFTGRREGRHPLLWVSTDNNMVLPDGTTTVRYAPAALAFPLRGQSREAVMDAHPWLYAVMTQELRREGKILADSAPGKGTIPDPGRFVFVEGCGDVGDTALTFALRVERASHATMWVSSDRGVDAYRITRDGCFRAAIPLPDNRSISDVRGLRVEVFARSGKPSDATARFTRVNSVFALDERYLPGRSIMKWQGSTALRPGGPPLEIPVP